MTLKPSKTKKNKKRLGFLIKKEYKDKMMKKIKPYFITPDLEGLIEKLDNKAFFVGGCVRDYLMHRPVGDIDMTTMLTPDEIKKRLASTEIRVIPTGIEHGTLTLILNDNSFVQITTFRTDINTDGRHAEVAFGCDIAQDAQRRDLTINALYMDKNGQIQDFTNSLRDLKKKRIRFIGIAEKRIEEDALRILRFFRFYGLFVKATPDKQAVLACRKKRELLLNISQERIKEEMFKIMSMSNPYKTIRLMQQTGVLKIILKQKGNLQNLKHLMAQEKKCGHLASPLFRLWVLNNQKEIPFKLSKIEKTQILLWEKANLLPLNTQNDFLKILYLYGKETFLNMILFKKKKLTFQAYRYFNTICVPVCPFTDSEIMNYFHLKGSDISQKTKKAIDIWIQEGFSLKKEVVFQKLSS